MREELDLERLSRYLCPLRLWRRGRFGRLFSATCASSSVFRRAMLTILRTGWGSDATTGARLAFTPERQR